MSIWARSFILDSTGSAFLQFCCLPVSNAPVRQISTKSENARVGFLGAALDRVFLRDGEPSTSSLKRDSALTSAPNAPF